MTHIFDKCAEDFLLVLFSTRLLCFQGQQITLNLSRNSIGDKGAIYLSSCLQNITELDLSFCNITEVGVQKISMALSKRLIVPVF